MFAYATQKYFASRTSTPMLEQVEGIADAAKVLEHGAVDVAIVDHSLTDGTGDALVRRIRDRLGHRCWIVGVGVESGSLQRQILDAGANIYLQKPIVLTDVLLSIELVANQGARDTAGAA
jgi:DNA-binding response OmpR family regulator